MTKKYRVIVFGLSVLLATGARAGLVWQQVDDGPCPGQVVVGTTGDDNDGYIVPSTGMVHEAVRHNDTYNTGHPSNKGSSSYGTDIDDGQMTPEELDDFARHLAE